jgi:hypothetical protein
MTTRALYVGAALALSLGLARPRFYGSHSVAFQERLHAYCFELVSGIAVAFFVSINFTLRAMVSDWPLTSNSPIRVALREKGFLTGKQLVALLLAGHGSAA